MHPILHLLGVGILQIIIGFFYATFLSPAVALLYAFATSEHSRFQNESIGKFGIFIDRHLGWKTIVERS